LNPCGQAIKDDRRFDGGVPPSLQNPESSPHPDPNRPHYMLRIVPSVGRSDSAGLHFLRDKLGARFSAGVVLYAESNTLEIEERIWRFRWRALDWINSAAKPSETTRGVP
jgi:hypothetical protein